MKIILSGSSGFIGREVLSQCLQNESITSVVTLSRSEISVSHPKLEVILMDDFLSYPDTLIQRIKGATACIWSLGKAHMPDKDEAKKVCLDYTIAAAKAFTPPSDTHEALRFVYLSGAASERDQNKPLWFMQDYRRIRGQVENDLIAHAGEHKESFETCIVRPGFVLAKEGNLRDVFRGMGPSVKVDMLAAAMIHAALQGVDEQIIENKAIPHLTNK